MWNNLQNFMHLSVGLSVSESAKLCSYMHFRDAICLQEKSLLQKANLDKAIDFMDTLEEDIPKGQSERMNRNSFLNSKFLEYLIDVVWLKRLKNIKINWNAIKHSRIYFFKLIWWILTFPVCRIMEFAVWARQWAGDPQESTVVRLRLLPRARHSHVRILLCWQRREESRPSIHVVRA